MPPTNITIYDISTYALSNSDGLPLFTTAVYFEKAADIIVITMYTSTHIKNLMLPLYRTGVFFNTLSGKIFSPTIITIINTAIVITIIDLQYKNTSTIYPSVF